MGIALIIGGSGSGKSAFAEDFLMKHSIGKKRYYIATMQVYGEEGRRKVERHRKMRQGKGFETIEQTNHLESIVENIEAGSAVLLECMSNLTANEMFIEDKILTEQETIARILPGIDAIAERSSLVVIVANNVFEDGRIYDETTMAYNRAMGEIHYQIAKKADAVIEVVAGIPNIWKGCVI